MATIVHFEAIPLCTLMEFRCALCGNFNVHFMDLLSGIDVNQTDEANEKIIKEPRTDV